MSYRIGAFFVLATIFLAGSASAHHNMSGVYDFNDRVTLTGTLTKFDWRNPHMELVIDAKRTRGKSKRGKAKGRRRCFSKARILRRRISRKQSEKP